VQSCKKVAWGWKKGPDSRSLRGKSLSPAAAGKTGFFDAAEEGKTVRTK